MVVQMDTRNLKNHVSFTSGQDVREICAPLNKHFGINSVVYHRLYNDGAEIKLGTNPKWLEHFIAQDLFQYSTFEHHPSLYQSGYVLWSQLKTHSKVLSNAKHYFQIANGATFINKMEDSCEFFFFGTGPENYKISNFYLNNVDIFENFIRYFKHQATPLIKQAEKNKLYIPNRFAIKKPQDNAIFSLKDEALRNKFMEEIKFDLSLINLNSKVIQLSKREMDCAQYLVQGNTGREIAKKLFISTRTVETHLANLKDKLNCASKSELIATLLKHGFSPIAA